jgi:cytochrome d ubiquinol oxidase subunit II
VFLLGALGLAYSLYPYVVMDRLTVWQAASATESLAVIAIGCAITVPAIVGYTIFSYRVFWGKARRSLRLRCAFWPGPLAGAWLAQL